MRGFLCMNSRYRFEGWWFEFHKYTGPWPLKKDGELRERAGRKFYAMFDRFQALDPPTQHECMTDEGGCMPFTIGEPDDETRTD